MLRRHVAAPQMMSSKCCSGLKCSVWVHSDCVSDESAGVLESSSVLSGQISISHLQVRFSDLLRRVPPLASTLHRHKAAGVALCTIRSWALYIVDGTGRPAFLRDRDSKRW